MNHNVLLGTSQCSSGCESGWTLYLEHSFLSPHPSVLDDKNGGFISEERREKYHESENEDLSMVSDASSGPPHFQEDDGDSGCFYNIAPPNDSTSSLKKGCKKQRIKENRRNKVQEQHHPSLLDDTASSPLFNFSSNNFAITNNQASMENVLDFSQGYSDTHFQRRSEFNGDFGLLQSSLSGNQLQQNQWCKGKRW